MQKPNSSRSNRTIIEPGEPPPGRWTESNDNAAALRWQGKRVWATRHGPALCSWREDTPASAHDVLMPNGTRGYAEYTVVGPAPGWRRPDVTNDLVPQGWIFGTVELSDRDAVFVDSAVQPAPVPPLNWGYPDLECDLWASSEIGVGCRERDFAVALYRMLSAHTWRYAFDGLWQCTSRAAGGIVANLRGRGENYHDYDDWVGAEALAAGADPTVEATLSRIGWHAIPERHFASIEFAARTLIAEWEARPERPRPAWYLEDREPQNAVVATRIGYLINRIHRLAATDRISQQEWRGMFCLLHGEG